MKSESWMQTWQGIPFEFMKPDPQTINISDIAHSLSMICRFTGHTEYFYSVAEHSIIMARMVPEEYKLEALLHDAVEAYTNDIARPLKQYLTMYKHIENGIDYVIRNEFGLPLQKSRAVSVADDRMIETERRQVMKEGPRLWYTQKNGIEPYDVYLPGWEPGRAKEHFLAMYGHLADWEKE